MPSIGQTVQIDTVTNQPREQKSIDGAACVTTGSAGQAHNRNLAAVATTNVPATNSAIWTSGVTDLEIVVPATASLTGVLVVYDAPSDAVAAAWLSDTGGASSDVAYDRLLPGTTTTKQFTAGITRIDFLAIGAATIVTIGAV